MSDNKTGKIKSVDEVYKDEHLICMAYTDAQLADIVRLRKENKEFKDIAVMLKDYWGIDKSEASVYKAYVRYSHHFEDKKHYLDILKQNRSKSRSITRVRKQNNQILDHLNWSDDVQRQLLDMFKKLNKKTPAPPKLTHSKSRKNMVMELMVSDVHVGKITDTFNLEVLKSRLTQLSNTVLREIELHKRDFNMTEFVLAFIGDIIESYTMHGTESARGCEFGNSRQVVEAINHLFHYLILPIYKTGMELRIPCVPGNHDRTEFSKTYNNPGEENVTYIIYKMLEQLCISYGLKNVEFTITKGPYVILDIFGCKALYEHGDNVKVCTKKGFEDLMSKRQLQTSCVIDFGRFGHWHEYSVWGRGRIIVNDSVPGSDSYSDVMGYDSHAGQTLNFYVETRNRPNCFYKSFPIYLK